MVLIVWQGIISIHQKTFLEALALQPQVEKVIMVVEQDISPYRKNMGWEVPQINDVELIRSPSQSEINAIFDMYPNATHILGGIRVGAMMTMAFNAGAKRKAKMGSLSEPYNKSGWKGQLRTLKYRYLRLRYFKHVQYFLAVGREGVKQYTGLGFDERYVFPWAYFISVDTPAIKPLNTTNKQRIIFGGRLEAGKGIYKFVQEIAKFDKEKYQFDIFGSGPDENEIKEFIAINNLGDTINIMPFMPYSEIVKQYAHYDWVVLPSSAKDGWGVVVSEGLLNGLKGLCSNICGVSWAIREGFNGEVFNWADDGSCSAAIAKMLTVKTYAAPDVIKNWAQGALSADAGAKYYLKIIDATYNKQQKPTAPWIFETTN